MVAIIKNNFRLKSAKEFIKNFESTVTDKNHYLFVGKPIPWRSSDGQQDALTISSTNADLHPPLPNDTLESQNRIWDEMLGLKKIRRNDVSLVVPRSNYHPRTIYAVYDDGDPNLHNRPTLEDVQNARNVTPGDEIASQGYLKAGTFYVLNSLNELFVCLSNNSGGPSTEEPMRSGNSTNLVESTSDKYVWKYITSITSGDAVKFLTDAWMPIKTITDDADFGTGQLAVQTSATPGEVLTVVVKNTAKNGEIPASFPNTQENGQIKILTTALNNEASVVSSPSQVDDAYTGYQLHITNPTTGVEQIMNISSYGYDEVTGTNRLVIEGTNPLSQFVSGQTYTCKILPRLDVYSNGTVAPVFVPVVDSGSKQIVGATISNRGQKATFVSITVPRPFVGTPASSILPTLRPVLSPTNGLGKDPEKDLGAFYVMISTQLKYEDGQDVESETSQAHLADFPVKNDYRQIGILQNAYINDNSNPLVLATANTLRATKRIRVEFASESTLGQIQGDPGFKSDEEISVYEGNTLVGQIRAIDFKFFDRDAELTTYQGEITFVQTPETRYTPVAVNQTLIGQTSNAQATVREVHPEEVKKFNGDILYIENRRPVIRSVDQIEDIKTIIEF
jgi:hypothetical protein